MIKRILVALSGTLYTTSAIRHAIQLANLHDAEITGAAVLDLEAMADVGAVPLGGSAAASHLVQHRLARSSEALKATVKEFEDACNESGVRHRVTIEEGDPFEKLFDLWRYHDLTILGLRRLFEFEVVENPTDYLRRLVDAGLRPLLATAETYRPIARVLISYNGSWESAKAMKRFIQKHPWPDLTFKIVCFKPKPPEARVLLSAAADYCTAHGYEVETEHLEGSAREGLLLHAETWKADTIVLGATHRNHLSQIVLGDTALHLIKHSPIPLFLAQ